MEELIASFFKGEADFFKENIIYKGGESYSFNTKLKFIARMLKHDRIIGSDRVEPLIKIDFKPTPLMKK